MEQIPNNDLRTILVMDGDPYILAVVSALLVDCEYNVLIAANAEEALRQSRDYRGEIHLLVSDFLMPGIELAREMALERPRLKVLVMSRFPERTLDLAAGWHFLAKPFMPSQLSALITGLVFPTAVPYSNRRAPANEHLHLRGAGAASG